MSHYATSLTRNIMSLKNKDIIVNNLDPLIYSILAYNHLTGFTCMEYNCDQVQER